MAFLGNLVEALRGGLESRDARIKELEGQLESANGLVDGAAELETENQALRTQVAETESQLRSLAADYGIELPEAGEGEEDPEAARDDQSIALAGAAAAEA